MSQSKLPAAVTTQVFLVNRLQLMHRNGEKLKNQITISNNQRENYLKEINEEYAIIEKMLKNNSLTKKESTEKTFLVVSK